MASVDHDVQDRTLAAAGLRRIDEAARSLPVLAAVRAHLAAERPLEGIRVSACLELDARTAVLARTLRDAGATVVLCGADPRSTCDATAAALVDEGIGVFAVAGEDDATFLAHLAASVDQRPHLLLDDGGDLIGLAHASRRELLDTAIAGIEDGRAGVERLREMEADGVLALPVLAVGEAQTRHLVDHRYGTGQAALDGVLRLVDPLIAGSTVVVLGYGWSGRGIAERARGMGAQVVVTEVDPLRALQAAMDGFRVAPIMDAARIGALFVTATGAVDVLRPEHMAEMRDGVVLANAGHGGFEIDVPGLHAAAVEESDTQPLVRTFTMADGRRIDLLAEGRPVGRMAGGAPAVVRDVGLATQALAAVYAVAHADSLGNVVYAVPPAIDEEVARRALQAVGVAIDGQPDGGAGPRPDEA